MTEVSMSSCTPSGVTPAIPAELSELVARLQADLHKQSCDLAALRSLVPATPPQQSGGQKQQPFSYSVEIPLRAGTTARTPATFSVSQDGPFVALAVQAAWRESV